MEIYYIYIYNEISKTYYNLILKSISLLIILLVIKINYSIILPLTEYRYLKKQILIKDNFIKLETGQYIPIYIFYTTIYP